MLCFAMISNPISPLPLPSRLLPSPIRQQLSLSTFDKNVMRNWRKARKLQRKNRREYAQSASLLDNTEDDDDTHEQEEGEEVITTMLPPSRHQPSAKQEKKKSRLLSLLAREKIRARRVKSSRSKSV